MKKILLILTILFCTFFVNAQNKKIDSLFEIIHQNNTDTVNTKAYILLSETYRNFNIDSAIYFAQKGLEKSKERKQKRMESYAQNALGYGFYSKGDYSAAIVSFQKYFENAKEINDKIAMGFAKNNEGNVYIELGNYTAAIEKYNEALDIRKQAKDTVGIAMSYNNMGYIYKDLGDYEKAISNFLFALKVYEKMNDQNAAATTYTYIASVYKRKHDYYLAHENLNNAIEIQSKQNDAGNLAISYHTKGTVYGDQKKYDSAVYFFKKAMPLYLKNDDKRQIGLLNADIAEIFSRKMLYDSAVVYFLKGININNSINNIRGQSSLLTGIANAYLQMNNKKDCKTYLDFSKNIIDKTHKKEDVKNYYKVLSEYYQKNNEYANSLQSLQQYNLYNDSLLNDQNQKAIADMQTKYDVDKKDQEIKLQSAQIDKRNIMLYSISGLFLLLMLLGISYYNRMKLKQRSKLQQEIMLQQDIATKAVIEAEENERKRIGSDLHDGVGQLMSAAKMNLSAIEDRLTFENEKDKEAFEKSIALVDEGCKEVRSVSHAIMPNALLRAGLSNALKEFIEKLDTRVIKINLYSEGLNERIESNIETVLYRIIQECVNNVIKHSKANILDISLIKDLDGVSVTIEDNGKGFDTSKLNKEDGIGIKNIQTRVNYLKGSIDIDSAIGRGTLVAIHVPLV